MGIADGGKPDHFGNTPPGSVILDTIVKNSAHCPSGGSPSLAQPLPQFKLPPARGGPPESILVPPSQQCRAGWQGVIVPGLGTGQEGDCQRAERKSRRLPPILGAERNDKNVHQTGAELQVQAEGNRQGWGLDCREVRREPGVTKTLSHTKLLV